MKSKTPISLSVKQPNEDNSEIEKLWEDDTEAVVLGKGSDGAPKALITSSLESRLAEIEETGTLETTVTVVKKKPVEKSTGFSVFVLGSERVDPNIIEINSKASSNYPNIMDDLLELEKVHEQLEQESIENLNINTAKIQHVKKKDKKKFIGSLDDNIQKITDFLIEEIAPKELAFNSALERSKEKLSLILDIPISELNVSYEAQKSLWRDVLNAKTFRFLGELLDTPPSELLPIMEKHLIPQNINPSLNSRLSVEQAYERILPKLREILELQKKQKRN
ncbi:MAG: hypothetical protein WC967_13275 [Balneolaceae bacterium]